MDLGKCRGLKARLAALPEPQVVVGIAEFFDGNDDPGSIGCNLEPHPGIDTFRDVLTGLLARADVEAVYAWIEELDPGEDYWPFTETVLVVGTIPIAELQSTVESLQPDDVADVQLSGKRVPTIITEVHSSVLSIWWD